MFKRLLNKEVTINFNWSAILAFVIFWTYGLFGSPVALYNTYVFIISILLTAGMFVLFLYFYMDPRISETYRDKIRLNGKDFMVALSYFVILLGFSLYDLWQPLISDEIYHAQDSQFYFKSFVYVLGSYFGDHIGNISFKSVLWGLDIVAFLVLCGFLYYFRKLNWNRIVFLVIIFVGVKLVAAIAGLGGSPHPPLRLLPLWISGTIFSSSAFAYRFPQLLGLVCFMWAAQRLLSKKLSFVHSWLFGLVVGTIPVIWHTGLLVEQSIWTACLWSVMLLVIILSDTDIDDAPIYWIRWFSLISIFSLMRQSAFIALALTGMLFLWWIFNNQSNIKLRKLFIILAPIIVMIPFITKSILAGTPATFIHGEASFLPESLSVFKRVIFSISSGVGPKVILNSVMIPWLILLLFAFIPFEKRNIFRIIAVVFFFFAAYFIFYSIRPVLWGVGRYQAEYVVPFAILGLANLVLFIVRYGAISRGISLLLLFCLLLFNVASFNDLPIHNASADERQKMEYPYLSTVVLSHDFYNYEDALNTVKRQGYAGESYIVDDYNANFNPVIYGYTIDEYGGWRDLRKSIKSSFDEKSFLSELSQNQNVKIVLIGRLDGGPARLIEELKALNWKPWISFVDKKYGSTIHGLIRTQEMN